MERKLRTVAKLAAESEGAFTQRNLRWLIANSENNGMKAAGALVRCGRRVLIDLNAFYRWLDTTGGRPAQPVKLHAVPRAPSLLAEQQDQAA